MVDGEGSCNFMGCSGGFSRPQGVYAHGDHLFISDGLLATVEVYSRATATKVATLGGRNTGFPELRLLELVDSLAEDEIVTFTGAPHGNGHRLALWGR